MAQFTHLKNSGYYNTYLSGLEGSGEILYVTHIRQCLAK